MPPAGELPLDVRPAVDLNREVTQVPVDRVHGTLQSRTVRFYRARAKQDVTASTVFRFWIAARPAFSARFSSKFLALDPRRTYRPPAAVNRTALIAGAAVSGGACTQSTSLPLYSLTHRLPLRSA